MSLHDFGLYVSKLESLVAKVLAAGSIAGSEEEILSALTSGPHKALREAVDIHTLRSLGTFFTGDALATKALNGNAPALIATDVVADPACGAGDLLIKCAQFLPLDQDLCATISNWGKQLIGYDLHVEFIRATRARLILTAITRGSQFQRGTSILLDECFPQICVGDYKENLGELAKADLILMNPPFNRAIVHPRHEWTNGKASTAAVFMDDITAHAANGTRVVAILPDVLRSGRRYARWRTMIACRAAIQDVELFGAFDRWTDVDVFLLRAVVDRGLMDRPQGWPRVNGDAGDKPTVGELFTVHVGPVVPHRDPELGPVYPYLHARSAPPWQTLTNIAQSRAYQGTVFDAPFVVVRRTSAPHDRHRAVGAVVFTKEKVAVENHLIVLVPKDGAFSACMRLMKSLQLKDTDDWLNQRIRCRHLTVDALKELPLFAS
jgi:hypothetical protein